MKAFLATLLLMLALPVNAAVVFMYHRFGEGTYASTNVTLEQFEAQLDFLDREGFDVWPLPKLVTHLRDHEPIPAKVVAITIDDAYASVYEHAYPMLTKRGMPFTVFVATDAVDQQLAGYMSWQQLKALHDAGVTLANHGASHGYLARRDEGEGEAQWRKRVRDDIVKGQSRLKEMLGVDANETPRLFAYPFGEYNVAMLEMLQQMGYVAFGQHSGPVGVHDELQALPRFPVNERYGDLPDFSLKACTLPFPVLEAKPRNPVVATVDAPTLFLSLGESSANLSQLSCYFGGERMEIEWISREQRQVEVSTRSPLPKGRSRYNCTAPHTGGARWYWYSHPWIRN